MKTKSTFDGKAFGQEVVTAVKTYLDEQLSPVRELVERLSAKLSELEAREPVTQTIKMELDASELRAAIDEAGADLIKRIEEDVDQRVSEAIKAIPEPTVPEATLTGKDVEDAIARAFEAWQPPPVPGEVIASEVQKALSELPEPTMPEAPKPEEVAEALRDFVSDTIKAEVENVAAGPAGPGFVNAQLDNDGCLILVHTDGREVKLGRVVGIDGSSVEVDTVRELIADEVKKLPVPKDGVGAAGAMIDRDGQLVLTMTNGDVVKLGEVVGKDVDMKAVHTAIQKAVDEIPRPKDGTDGIGFDDLTVEHDGERTLSLKFVRGDKVKAFDFVLPVVLDRGVYKSGRNYVKGDGVSFGGCFWIAQEDTTETPKEGKAWRLSVKKGRDGKDVVSLPRDPNQPVKV